MKTIDDRCVAPNQCLLHNSPGRVRLRPRTTMNAVLRALLATLTLLATLNPALHAASREAEWKKVDEAVGKGLPKTAVEALEPIITAALKDKAYGEVAKA